MKVKQAAGRTVLLLGDAKDILTQSGLDLKLLSEEASISLWHARDCLFIDAAASVIANAAERRKLVKKVLAQSSPPLRSVVLTVDCETFLAPDGANAVAAKARDYRAFLDELARPLGVSYPVYVLFTKAEKITYFPDFVKNLNETEAAGILGVSLAPPVEDGSDEEEQALRLNQAFQTIYYWLADRRPVFLRREQNPASLSNIYEFPREFAKLRPLVVQFLTDVCGSRSYLRGFYFCGSRIFVQNLLLGLVLADSLGTRAQANAKANFARRLLLAVVAAGALLMAAWWSLSYHNNAQLVQDAVDAVRALPNVGLTSGRRLASSDSLRVLSKVRERLEMVNDYERRGAPLSYRAGLYQGVDIRRSLRNSYYAMFRRLLLQPVQQTLIEIARNPGDYQYVYNALKAYLITTVNHDKYWKNLAVVLDQYWKKELPAGSEREAMALANFAFYAEELPKDNPYGQDSSYDKEAVETARAFLNSFPAGDGLYPAEDWVLGRTMAVQ